MNWGGFLSVDDVSEKAYLYNITTAGKEGEMLTHVVQKQTGIQDHIRELFEEEDRLPFVL